ncbi:MAG: ATP-binding cassette domain-containing protein, partial [Clostridium celatum]|nr:ATP-binding cassette domain-containing protein [Clostridium celatum]
ASLILNNHKVTNGEIRLNDINIENISLDNIYGNIALVSTNSYIFNGSILDNLLMAKKDATKEELEKALKTARLYDFVNGLKDGLLTDVGQAGSALSGGQKQRLALARVILADRPMIIFDEATSNIDVESEESIWEAIYELSKDKTVLVISHRLANVKEAKNIYVMNKGILVENGTHDELMSKESHYYNMVNKQNELEMIREVC